MKARRRNIKLTLSYDGTNYHGFQRQTKVVAVQNVLEGALFKLFGDSIELAAAGRTDAGVHAIGQVVNFFTDGTIPIQNVVRAGNRLLPDDIVLLKAEEADRDFSALHSVKSKIYIYKDGNLIHTKWLTVPTMEATCASVFDETSQGDYEAYATAYNDAGESEGTQPIPFAIDEYVSTPATPTLRIEIITVQ